MAKNEIVEVTPAKGEVKNGYARRVLVATVAIQKFRLNIYQDANLAMIENLIKLIADYAR